ncbi:MAG: hypothetical protein AB3X44_13835 [Leptothrix sp. (in: b-proteobacteria)]
MSWALAWYLLVLGFGLGGITAFGFQRFARQIQIQMKTGDKNTKEPLAFILGFGLVFAGVGLWFSWGIPAFGFQRFARHSSSYRTLLIQIQ